MTARTTSARIRIPDEAGRWLLPTARQAITAAVTPDQDPPRQPVPGWAEQPGACFVTLTVREDTGHQEKASQQHRPERLRGCIGTLTAWRRLSEDLPANAVAAATRDPRFPPVRAEELAGLRVEVSVLSPGVPIDATGEQDLRSRLRPGVDGLILRWRDHRGTFLPQVWAQLPDPRSFLDQLKVKAGLPVSWWSDDAVVERYTVDSWQEQ